MNKLIAIGNCGHYCVFLNLTREEAIERFVESKENWHRCSVDDVELHNNIHEVDFDDRFYSYEVGEI